MSGKTKPTRLGIGDLFLLFVLLISVVSGFLRFREMKSSMIETDVAEYRILLLSEAMHTQSADCLREGEILYSAAGDAIGRVTDITLKPLEVRVEADAGGVTGVWPIEQKCRLLVEIAVLGRIRDGVLLLNGRIPIPVGLAQTLFGERMMLSGVVVGVLDTSA